MNPARETSMRSKAVRGKNLPRTSRRPALGADQERRRHFGGHDGLPLLRQASGRILDWPRRGPRSATSLFSRTTPTRSSPSNSAAPAPSIGYSEIQPPGPAGSGHQPAITLQLDPVQVGSNNCCLRVVPTLTNALPGLARSEPDLPEPRRPLHVCIARRLLWRVDPGLALCPLLSSGNSSCRP